MLNIDLGVIGAEAVLEVQRVEETAQETCRESTKLKTKNTNDFFQ